MNELIQAATAFFKAGAEYFAKAGNPLMVAPTASEAVPEKKTRAKKAEAAAPAPAPAAAADPLLDNGGAAASPTLAAPAAQLTEAESALKAQEANKALVKAFPAPQADKMPEGFHKAKALLAEFGVARTTDLVHAQRVQYIAKIDALIAARPA